MGMECILKALAFSYISVQKLMVGLYIYKAGEVVAIFLNSNYLMMKEIHLKWNSIKQEK